MTSIASPTRDNRGRRAVRARDSRDERLITTIDEEQGVVIVRDGDTVKVELPAVISVGDAINEPRYPSLKAIMGAKKKPLDTKSTGDAEIDASRVGSDGSRTQVLAINPPPEKQAGEIIEDEDTDETVQRIVSWLEERKLLA